MIRLPCSHLYHDQCIEGWLLDKNCTCPLCLWEFPTDDDTYNRQQKQRMKNRKPRYYWYELERTPIRELKQWLPVGDKFVAVEKRDLFEHLIDIGAIQAVRSSPRTSEAGESYIHIDGGQKIPECRTDLKVAVELQAQDIDDRMLLAKPGRAFKFVETMIQLHHQALTCDAKVAQNFSLMGQDDMVFLAERFLECQEKFADSNKPAHVTLAYHYTSQMNLQSIRENGLLFHPEQKSKEIRTKHGAYFGYGEFMSGGYIDTYALAQ